MSRFKVGDLVVAISGHNTTNKSNLDVVDLMKNWINSRTKLMVSGYDVYDNSYRVNRYEGGEFFWFHEDDLRIYGHPINEVNKMLYPDYIEKDGLLLQKE